MTQVGAPQRKDQEKSHRMDSQSKHRRSQVCSGAGGEVAAGAVLRRGRAVLVREHRHPLLAIRQPRDERHPGKEVLSALRASEQPGSDLCRTAGHSRHARSHVRGKPGSAHGLASDQWSCDLLAAQLRVDALYLQGWRGTGATDGERQGRDPVEVHGQERAARPSRLPEVHGTSELRSWCHDLLRYLPGLESREEAGLEGRRPDDAHGHGLVRAAPFSSRLCRQAQLVFLWHSDGHDNR
eukprot:scaffold803_cov310-Pinguiococcus_pyrenoidosus.AAC.197